MTEPKAAAASRSISTGWLCYPSCVVDYQSTAPHTDRCPGVNLAGNRKFGHVERPGFVLIGWEEWGSWLRMKMEISRIALPHWGHVLAKYFCPIVLENFSLNVGTRLWMYARTVSGSSVIPERMQISPSVSSIFGARRATTGIFAPHLQHEYIFPIRYTGGSIVSLSSSI